MEKEKYTEKEALGDIQDNISEEEKKKKSKIILWIGRICTLISVLMGSYSLIMFSNASKFPNDRSLMGSPSNPTYCSYYLSHTEYVREFGFIFIVISIVLLLTTIINFKKYNKSTIIKMIIFVIISIIFSYLAMKSTIDCTINAQW